jgi:hypothetical protein
VGVHEGVQEILARSDCLDGLSPLRMWYPRYWANVWAKHYVRHSLGVGTISRLLGKAKEWAARLLLMFVSFTVALALAEVVTRFVYPISDGRENVTLDGDRITSWLEPNSVYRQVSNEYDALTTITEKGHRVPEVAENPDVVFIGDSFTFGWGVSDAESFVTIYCLTLKISCANLGEPGTGTARQIDNLERHLEAWSWRPKEVKLVLFAMSASFSSGNDLEDNYIFGRRSQARTSDMYGDEQISQPELLEKIVGLQHAFLKYSNLVRIAKYHWGPVLRSLVVPRLDEDRLRAALGFTQTEFRRLVNLSRKYEFAYSIYLIHPVQDIMRGTYVETLENLNAISPVPIHDTAHLYLRSPERFYYSYDGHLNSAGARELGQFLVSQESSE